MDAKESRNMSHGDKHQGENNEARKGFLKCVEGRILGMGIQKCPLSPQKDGMIRGPNKKGGMSRTGKEAPQAVGRASAESPRKADAWPGNMQLQTGEGGKACEMKSELDSEGLFDSWLLCPSHGFTFAFRL